MANVIIDDSNFTNIADAIRGRLHNEQKYLPSQMAGAITHIPSQKVEEELTKDVNFASGDQVIEPTVSGEVITKVTLTKPDTLVASNIKTGVSIEGITGSFTSDANATSSNILSGKTAYIKGNKVTGNMPEITLPTPTLTTNISGNTATITATESITNGHVQDKTSSTSITVTADQVTSGNVAITNTSSFNVTNAKTAQVSDANLVSANILTGKTILGVQGSGLVPSGTLTIKESGTYNVTQYANANVDILGGLIDVYTETEMDAILTDETKIGAVCNYLGETGKYIKRHLYLVQGSAILDRFTLPAGTSNIIIKYGD